MLSPETAHFGEIFAIFHFAPLTAAMAARIRKKPVTDEEYKPEVK